MLPSTITLFLLFILFTAHTVYTVYIVYTAHTVFAVYISSTAHTATLLNTVFRSKNACIIVTQAHCAGISHQ